MLISEIKKEFDRRFVKEDSYQTGLKRIIYEDNQPEEIWQFIEEQIREAKKEQRSYEIELLERFAQWVEGNKLPSGYPIRYTHDEAFMKIYEKFTADSATAESNREAYKQGVIDAIDAIVLDEKDLPKGFEKVKSVQMKKAKEFLKDL